MKKFLTTFGIILVLLVGVRFIPWSQVNWGKFELLPASTITVTGEARLDTAPQIARFTASVEAVNKDKQTAIDEVNTKMTKIIKAVKDFGIPESDIQTQTVSVYQTNDQPEILIYPPRSRIGDHWRATNSITITLRDIDQTSALADLLQTSGATSVDGPNFSLDDTTALELDLLEKAIANAREKAQKIAAASGRKLGKVITVDETGTAPIFRGLGLAVSEKAVPAPVEPGSETVYKTVTVVFELK